MDASVTAACIACLPGQPTGGSVAISLDVRIYPPSPCRVKSVTGVLTATWNDGRTSSAAVTGKFRDSSTLTLEGTFSATDPVFPGDPAAILLSNYPANPCLTATNPVTGTLAVATP